MALKEEIPPILDKVYAWSKDQEFRGYNKHDGLNSPLLQLFLGWAKWPRLIAIQSVMRAPCNIRPLLGVPRTLNPKGLGLFASALLDMHIATGDKVFLVEAEQILQKLLDIRSQGSWSGNCWGYPYPWQDLGFFAQAHTPNAVVSCFVCEAFLKAFRVTGKSIYLEVVGGAIHFFMKDLTVLKDTPDSLCLGYMPMPMKMRVIDVSILIGAVIAQYCQLSEDTAHFENAKRLVGYVVSQQTDYGAWFYTDPPGDSFIRHDNYHTGFILDALWRYMEAASDWSWRSNYEQGLAFYAEHLFNEDGSPRWMSDKDFPHDVHGSAQGLITFSLAVANGYNYRKLLDQIADWAIRNLYHPSGRFYYQKGRYYTKKFTLLRWCNAWMFRGLSAWRVSLDR
ncbi:glycoside hydrolase family protein [Desulfogranum japonicum]|uniref:hypothetical protein n=1 Tax=Desulfogranum japonicum TaxID=231447 RepID=UPI00041345E6|nr:hypothetical protein [Desulfogranum japonicum]